MRHRVINHLEQVFATAEVKAVTSHNKLPYIGNRKCHINSLSYALKNSKKVKAIKGGIQVFDDDYVAHFIIELNDGTLIDPTFGNVAHTMYCGFIELKEYKEFEVFQPTKELIIMKEYIYNQLPWYYKLFFAAKDF